MNDASYILKEYRKAEPWLNVLSDDPETVPREKYDKEVVEQRVKIEGLEEQLRQQGEIMAEVQRTLRLIRET